MAARPPVPTLTTLTCVLLVQVQLTTQVTPPPCNPGDNLYAPVFINSVVQQTIRETLPIDASVATLSASDKDTLCNFGSLTYSITGDGSAASYFGIEKDTGIVSLKTSLTNTSIVDFTVRIEVQDGSSPPWSSTALLYLKITRNFERPVWSSATYATNIPETTPVLENILRVTATDRDAQPPNNEVTYELVGDAVQLYYFEIVSSTGDIRPRRPLTSDTNRRSQFDFVVIARDKGSPPLTAAFNASVIISVFRNNNAPRFIQDSYSITVSQGLGSGTVISVRAVDDDSSTDFNQIRYNIEGPANALTLFTIDQSGSIQPTNPAAINSASETNYKIYVRAEDNGSPKLYDTALVELTINRNLNPPIFNPVTYEQTILETRRIGDVVLRMTASDADNLPPYNTVEFAQIPNGATGLTFFSLEADTGNVVLRRPLTGNPDSVYEFQALVRDKGVPSREQSQRATVRITVRRNNNDPFFVGSPYSVTINEDQAVGSQLLPVVAQDSDVNSPFNQVTLRVIGDEKGPIYFGLANNQINVTRNLILDAENDLRYTLRIEARDGGSPARSATALVYITVNRNLNPPVFTTQAYSARIPETQQLAVSVVQVQATDGDRVAPYNTLRYEISGAPFSTLGRQYFMVDSVTGVVSVRRNLETDTSDISVYRFIVDAIDGSGVRAPQPANVDITVDRNLFPPVFITTNYTAVINNTTPQGSPVFTALATDADSTSPFNVVRYSIIGDDGSQSFFSVDATSGAVSLAQQVFSIPNTQFRVRLQAVDGSGLTDVEVLTVFIQRNLFAPVFTQTLYERVIQETIPVSTSILNVFAQDSDQTAPYSTVSYFTSGSSDRFLVNVNNGAVTVRRSLIGESGQTFTFQVYAQDGGTPPLRSRFVTVRINVTRNNFPPVFVNEPYSQSLLATASAGDGVVQVTATDADVEIPFNNVRYDITGDDNAPAIFQIDESSGQISLRNTFSGDGAELHRIRVRARDGGNPRLSDITVVSVNVTRNLRAPVFNTPTYSARILETINFGEVFISATAQDLDTSAPNNALTYQLTGNTECQRYFGINNNGGLYVQADLVTDPTRATFYTCQVSAQDQGNPRRDSTNQATVSINVIRNTAPEFTNLPYNAVLQRNITTGTVVGTFTVTDSDTDAPFNERNFRILGDGNAPALFNLNGNNVVVTSATDLAADTTTSYTVRLEVRDGGRSALSGTAVMDIQVIRNLATPVFSNSFIERNINENYPVGGLITILNATDSDPQAPNNVLTYLALNPSSTDYLYVNPINGEVRTQRSFIGSTVRQYDFLVRVQDGGSPPKTAVATVRVNVARDSQTLAFRQDNYVFTMVENTPVTSNIINVEAIPGPDVIYRLIGYSDSGDYFRVNPNNGQITLIKDLTTDVSRRPTFYLQVEAEKQFTVNLQKAIANVTITVQRNTNSPIFNETDSIYEVIIDETRALGSSILQLYAPDADGDTVRYEVINYQAGETDFLYLGPFSGLIRVAKPLTSTNTRRFEFTVRARDGMNPERSSTASVIVNVRGDNQPPAFINEPYNSRLNFSDPVGTRVFIVQGTDPDLIGQMNYELTGQYLSAPAFFRVDRTTGEVFLSSSISTESTSTYTLGLSTFDSARPTRRDFTNLTITVNQNPNVPAFTTFSYDRTISETYDLGVSVIQIEASDPDGQTLSYTVEAANPTDCDSYFLLGASGLIVASRALTTSSFPQCTMTVRIQDNGVPVRQSVGLATATIRIDRNNNAPVFGGGPYTRTIPETQNIGFTVFQFQATDADQPNTEFSRLEYSLIGDDNTGNFFEINSQTGVFTVRSQLDRNDIDRYVARVVVKDGGSPSKSATVTGIVNILRNLNGPLFNPTFYNATIFETHALRDSIVRVVATDADRSGPQSTFTFSLQDLSGNFASTYFRIDATSGNIFARLPLTQDLTDTSFVEFSVTATDQGVPVQISVTPARVRVNIIRNLNPPVFQSEPFSARIDFTAPVNSPVINVQATDADFVDPFNRVTYSLIGDGLATSLFTVTPDTGAIRTQNTLNSDNSEQYVLRVVAMDGGTPRLTDTSTVLVTVNRNLNAPQLQPQNYSVGILATQALSIPILTINAADADVAVPYNTVVFRPTSSPLFSEFFGVDPSSGDVYVKKDLALRSDISTFIGTVSVCDSASSPRCSDVPSYVTVLVTHNQNTPFFINEPYRRDLQRTLGAGTGVLTVQAVDRDDPSTIFGRIRYTLIGDDQAPNFFSINPTSGLIEISNALGQTSDNLYQLRVQACDLGGLCNRTTVIVTITTNFQAPIISPATYTQTVQETISLGTPIIDVNATDADPTAPNNQITYVISEGPEDLECFTINPDTGVITARRSLLYNPCTASVYSMLVVARDRGSPSLESTAASVTINVQRNDNPPIFTNEPYTTSLREDASINDSVFTVNAVDTDIVAPFNTIQFSLIGDDTAPVYFDIRQTDNNNAQIFVKAPVLNDDKTTYIVRVRAADGGIPSKSDTTTVRITVNRNLFAPRFDPINYNITIFETQSLGLSIFQVTATDGDSKSPHRDVRYEATGDGTALTYFNILSNSGTLYVQRDLRTDTQKRTTYNFVISSRDLGVPSLPGSNIATVTINVLRNLNCPAYTTLPRSITINQTATGVIFNVDATDADTANEYNTASIRYQIVGDDNANNFFSINPSSGQITALASISTDTSFVYRVRVNAADGGSPSCTAVAVLTVNVRRNLNPPVFTQLNVVATILETHSVEALVSNLLATDFDTGNGAVISYGFETSSQWQNLFRIDANTGNVFLRRRLIGVTGNQFVMQFLATDNGNPRLTSTPATLTVNVLRNNFPPEFLLEPYNENIRRDVGPNTLVTRVVARDNDTVSPFNRTSFTIIGDENANAYFRMDPTTGQIFTTSAIDSVATPVFNVRVVVSDGGEPALTDTSVVRVFVNRNLASPAFNQVQYTVRILEDQLVGLPLTPVTCTDADNFAPYNQVRYALTGNSTVLQFFQVNTVSNVGTVSLKRAIYDYPDNTVTQLQFQVTCEDLGNPSRAASNSATVFVTIVRNTPPFFDRIPYSTIIPATQAADTSVFQVAARDNDVDAPFNEISLSLLGDSNTPSYFTLSQTGLISVRSGVNLTTDTRTNYVARVQVRDGGTPSLTSTALVAISVTRNFFAPVFSNSRVQETIPETTPVGTTVTTLTASDRDTVAPNGNFQYRLVSGTGVGFFYVDPNNGQVVLLRTVEGLSTQRFFTLNVEARDEGTPSLFATAIVEVSISFDPDQLVFGAGEYNITISENTPVNTIITQVQAQPQAGVVYTVTGLSSGPDFFLVGGSTGQVRVQTLLTSDAAELTGYRLRVRATRTGVSSQTAFTTVNIIVNRNINAPVFDRAQYLITIPDTTPLGSVLDTVRATDADGDVIEYTLLTGQPASDFFLVGPRDGSITLKTTLIGTTQNVYQFTIQADDQKVPRQKTSTVQVTVNITRDAGAPRFIGIPYSFNIREDVAESSSIFTVTATDDDLRGQIEFVTIGQGVAEAFFTLNTQPAQNPRESFVIVRDTSALRNDVTQQYTLRVRAYDTAYPNNPATTDVTINIERNLNSPQFSSQRYQVTIYATQVLGVPIIQVNASDADGDNLMFEITGSSQAQAFYNINPLTGEIYVKRSLLEGNQLNDQISLRVRDQRTPEKYGTAEVDVTIKRDRFTPEFQNQPYIRNNFPYRSNVNDNVLTVLATDRDLEGTIVYEVTGVYPAPSFFRVNNETGLVDLSQQLTTISGDYRLRVIAYDSFYPNNAATSTVTILVDTNPNTPICNPPVISQTLDTGSLLTPVGFVIGTVNATDADGDQISYSIVNGDPEDYRYFIVDPTDGTLRLREPIDNSFTGFNFQIQASDRGVPTAKVCTTFVSITVQRDDAPFFVNEPYSNTIDETVTTGTPVFRVEAQDNNLKGRIVYGLVGDLRAPYFFTINDTNGIITLRNSIRTDTFMSYKARVTAYDSGSTTRTATATVDLTVNRNAGQPAFGLPSYDTTIEELTAVGTNIINVTATDSDQDVLRYTLEGNPVSVNGLQYFGINSNTGKISVIRPLTADVARTSQYVMTVRVTDQRQPVEKSSTAQVTVNVLRNLNKPYFRNNPYSRQISELTTVSTSIITVTAVDDDLKGDLILDVVGEGSAPSYFSLTPATRVATTRNAQVDLRNSVRSDRGQFQYVLVVRAYDSFYPQDFVEERIVIDVTRNEFAPEYINTPYRVTIDEDTPVGRAVIDVNATDRNGDRIYYAAYGEADTMQLFQLDPNSGVVTLIRPLVPGTQMQYTMRVNATDGGLPERWTPVEVIITIRRDQFAPIFIGNYQTNVFETQAVPSDVPIVVQATDQDGVVGQIVYKATGIYPALSFFEVDGTSGQIRLIRDLKMDFSKPNPYLLEVTAEDSARPRKKGTATVTINIIRNPNTPQWGLRSYSANIPEDYPVPGPVVNVTATDLDAGDKIRYSLNSEVIQRDVSIGPIGYFYIDTETGLISLRRSVLGSGIRQFTLGITACDNGYPVRCVNTTAVITINRDGQSPVWQNSPYNVRIQETHAAGTFVLSVRAVDPDLKPGSQVVYEFVNRPAFFALDELSGNITLENSVLFDSNTQYNFQVRAYDRLDKPRSVTADVTVFVIRNANPPSFLRQPYQTTISEYYTVGSEVLNTTAVDLDGDVPLYSFVNPTNEFASKFYIDPRDGIIYLRSSMERTPITLYNVTISATDQRLVSPRSNSTYAEIRVDLDDTPQFTQNPYNQPIQESFTVGTSVIAVQAFDPDLQGDIRYGIDGLYPAESFFGINSTSGIISLRQDIKNEPLQLSSYTLRVFAYDTAHPTRRGSSSVLLSLVRDPNAPRFIPTDQYETTVDVNTPIGDRIENTTAIDLDGDTVTYRVVTAFTNTQKYFYLDPDTGDIHVRAPLTSAPENFYSMVVQASDGRGGTANATVTIEINRPRNRDPTFTGQPYNANILVTQPANSYVTRVTATDADLQGSIEYEAVGVYPARDFFRLNKTTGEIYVSRNLTTDPLRTPRYTLRVQAYDTAFPTMRASEDVVIFVNLNPNGPVFNDSEYRISIPENYPLNSMLLGVGAFDPDGDSIQYVILQDTEGQTASRYFTVGTTSGIIFTRSSLQAAGTPNFFRFTVQAVDNGSPRRTSQIFVYVTIERDAGAPVFSQVEYQTNIPENTAVNDTQPVLTVFANDADRKGSVKYVITGDGLGMAFFWMDENNGRLYVRRPLTSTTTSRFDMTVAAFDSEFPLKRSTARVTVYVDRNVGVPQFTAPQYSAQVFEFTNTGTSVLRTNASDSDGDTVRYSMVLPNDEAQMYFFIDDRTGDIYVRRSLSLNTQSQYVFQVRASDQRDPPKESDTQVVIQVLRDTQPRFIGTPYFASASESNTVDTFIFDVNAVDDNLRGQLVYEIIGDIPAPSYFKINSTTGVISVRSNLTTVQSRQYTLRVSVYDSDIPSVRSTQTVIIQVDVNSNAPKFTLNPYVINISEDKQIGTLVTTVTAVDPDGDKVTYNLEATTNAGSYFFLNGATGDIYLIRSVQNIPNTQFSLPVRAYDRPILTQEDRSQVIINIQKDQFPPEFLGTPYRVTGVPETIPVGTVISSAVSARDPDLKGSLVFEATGIYPAQTFFDVNRNDGRINVTQDLKNDGLGRDSYTLQITVYDSQVPDARVTENVEIGVVRNANSPQFSQTAYTRTILETHQLAVPVININATDQDRDAVTYQLTSDLNGADGLSYFYIVRETGIIYPRRQLIGLGGRTYTMNVRATDNGRPTKTSDVTVNIIITGIQRPTFSSSSFATTVREDRTVTASIYQFSASKPNLGGSMVYEVQGEGLAPYFFAVNQTTGIVTVRNDLRSGRDTQYTLRVRAYDSEFPTFWAESTLVITVTRNPSSPLFIGKPYSTTIQDNAGLGTTVTNVISAQDADQRDKLTFTITGDTRCQETFYMNPDTGVVLLGKNLRVATTPSFTCSIQVTDNGFPTANVDTTTLVVNVGSIQFPQFTQNEYSATVDEKNPLGTFVVDVQATKNPPGNMVYEVVGEYPAPTFFGINNRTGRVTIINDLRPDGNREYKLLVAGYDSLYPDLRSTSTVRITVNRNGFGPEFSPTSVSLNLPETTSTESWSRPINVTDRDSSMTTCEISGTAKAQEFFAVDSRTCLLTLKKNLTTDTDRTTRYDITIIAKDNGNPARTGTTVVTVNVPRDTAIPIIRNLPASVTVEESAQPTDLVYTIDPFDADLDGSIRCRMIGDWPSSTFFTLDSATGQVRINNSPKLDTMSRDEYKVRIQCYDTAWPDNRAEGLLTVNVRRNPAFPAFTNTPYSRSIPDTFPLGSTILQLSGQDPDGDSVTFSNQGTDTDKSFYYVNPTTGVVVLLKDLRSTDRTSFEIPVQVSDGRGKTGDAIVRITVTKNSGPPVFSNTPYETRIPVTQPVGTRVLSLSVNDPDRVGTIVCQLEGYEPGQTYFDLNNVTHAITVRANLTLNPQPDVSYVLLAKCFDSGNPSEVSYTTAKINVERNLASPQFSPTQYTATINDYDPKGTSVVAVTATDSDPLAPENQIMFSLSDGSRAANDYFTVHPFTGLITVSRRVSEDPTTQNRYILYVVAQDTSLTPRSSTATVTVLVARNQAPVFLREDTYSAVVDEEAPVLNYTILTVTATDSDDSTTLNGQVRYSILSSGANRVFQMNPATGAISPRIDLRRVTQPIWRFDVQATDAGIPPLSDTAAVFFTISKLGLPTFTQSEVEININENRPVNDSIYTITATDPITGSVLQYELRGDGLGPNFFSINRQTGQITVSRPLIEDTQKVTVYTLRVVAFRLSNTAETTEAIVRVNVLRNPNAPVFPDQTLVFNLPENQPLGVEFGRINATDSDRGDNGVLDFSIDTTGVTPSYSYGYFFVNPTTGALSVITRLSEDSNTQQYLFNVMAIDRGSPRRTASVTVTVNVARNPGAPVFAPNLYERTVPEVTPEGTSIVDVNAADADGDTVTYTILQEPPDSYYFNIVPTTGLITLARSFTQELQDRYIIRVVASDGRSSPRSDTATVTVNIVRNPNAPKFNPHNGTVDVSEYRPIQTVITTIRATDNDTASTLGGQLRYSITGVSPISATDYFIISPTSGDILLAKPLANAISPNRTELTIQVTDRAARPKTDVTTLVINTIRNMYAPEFTAASISANASERDPIGRVITNVTATDADVNVPKNQFTPNAQIEYRIIGNAVDVRSFGIASDGSIFITQPLSNDNAEGNYVRSFKVLATDRSWNPKFSEIQVNVSVTPLNVVLGDLGFIQPVYYKEIPENVQNKTVLFLDVVNQQNNEVTCSIISGDETETGLFTTTPDTDRKNCYLMLMRNLDREQKDIYKLRVRVSAAQSRNKRAIGTDNAAVQTYNSWRIADIVLIVTDVNDNNPIFKYQDIPANGYNKDQYYGAISIQAKPDEQVLRINATDLDIGPNGLVTYGRDISQETVPPFGVTSNEGLIFTTTEFDQNPTARRQIRFGVQAQDNPTQEAPRVSTTTVVVDLIEDYNRFILVMDKTRANEIIPNIEVVRKSIQDAVGFLTLIERVEGKRTRQSQNNIVTEMESTDIVFVLVGNEADYSYALMNNTNKAIQDSILSDDTLSRLNVRIGSDTSFNVERVRLPYPQASLIRTMVTKSYIWWMDDPWAALIALAAIIILLSIVGIIVIVFSYSRYMKFIQQYRLYQHNYGDAPEFTEPPSFLREYETQSLNMYVPPDEQIQSVGEINMTFEGDTMKGAMHTNHGEDVAAVVNPIFQGEGHGQQQLSYNESTTIL